MEITILSAVPLTTKYKNVVNEKPVLNDNSDVVIVNSDDYFGEKLTEYLLRLKNKYLAVFAIGFNKQELLAYNNQYLEFCFENNIVFLDFDEKEGSIDNYLQTNISFVSAYSKFVKFYIEFQPTLDYSFWFEGDDFQNKKVVDLGCGVPTYLNTIDPKDYTGYDLSADMINIAKKKWPQKQFEVADILDVDYQADVVISILDVLNYIPSFTDVQALITNIYKNLNENGLFIFDIHKKAALNLFKNYFTFEDFDDEQFIWETNVEHHKITHYLQMIDKDYKLHIEKHVQYYYDKELIVKELKRAGFKNITIKDEYNHHIIRAYKKEIDE